MKFVAVTKPPADVAAAVKVLCTLTAQVPAEARMRLAGEPPMIVARLADEEADALAAGLVAAKIDALALDVEVPTDDERLVARGFAFESAVFELLPRTGEPLRTPYGEIELLLRGVRVHQGTHTRTETKRKLDIGRALLTQGLMITKVEKHEVISRTENPEHFLLVYAASGVGAINEEEVTFQSLGKELQPSRLANVVFVTEKLRRLAPQARYDDRLLRLGRRPLAFDGDPVNVVAEILRRS